MRSVFMARLIGETEKIVDAAQIPAVMQEMCSEMTGQKELFAQLIDQLQRQMQPDFIQ